MRTFDYFGKQLYYLQQDYPVVNHIGERTIAVPIGVEFISKFPILEEVGAVMPYHLQVGPTHNVVDPFDPWPGCIKMDPELRDFTGENALSISTLERAGTSDYGNTDIDPDKGCPIYQEILDQADNYFITIPLGYNTRLDTYIRNHSPATTFMYKQYDPNNRWVRIDVVEWDARYRAPFPYANVVAFITNLNMGELNQ